MIAQGGAIVSFARTAAVELAPRGIRVNANAPGMIVVEHIYSNVPDADADAEAKKSVPAQIPGDR